MTLFKCCQWNGNKWLCNILFWLRWIVNKSHSALEKDWQTSPFCSDLCYLNNTDTKIIHIPVSACPPSALMTLWRSSPWPLIMLSMFPSRFWPFHHGEFLQPGHVSWVSTGNLSLRSDHRYFTELASIDCDDLVMSAWVCVYPVVTFQIWWLLCNCPCHGLFISNFSLIALRLEFLALVWLGNYSNFNFKLGSWLPMIIETKSIWNDFCAAFCFSVMTLICCVTGGCVRHGDLSLCARDQEVASLSWASAEWSHVRGSLDKGPNLQLPGCCKVAALSLWPSRLLSPLWRAR